MSYEKIKFNGELILEYDFNNKDAKIINIEEAQNLTWANEKNNQNISSVKYISNNTILSTNHPISKLMSFVNGMLWFRSVCDNQYIEFKNGYETLSDIILKNNKIKDFENFLREEGVDYDLIPLTLNLFLFLIGVKIKLNLKLLEQLILTT